MGRLAASTTESLRTLRRELERGGPTGAPSTLSGRPGVGPEEGHSGAEGAPARCGADWRRPDAYWRCTQRPGHRGRHRMRRTPGPDRPVR